LAPPTHENLLKVLAQPVSEGPGVELLERIDDYTDAAAIHFETVKNIESAMEEELTAYQRLEDVLEGEDLGTLEADDIITARQHVRAAMLNSERAKAGLEDSSEELEDALRALGIGTGPGRE